MLAIGLNTGFMPASYSQQGVECKGTDISKQCEFTCNGKIDTLPPQHVNTNENIIDENEDLDIEEWETVHQHNYVDSLMKD